MWYSTSINADNLRAAAMTLPRVGVIGGGTVGRATARCWMEHAEVRVCDIRPELSTHTIDEVIQCDVVFMCLPSLQKTSAGDCDTSIIEDMCNMLGGSAPQGTYALRSTVPVGFTKRMRDKYGLVNLVHNPEFLTARCANTDIQVPTRNIVGGEVVTGFDLVKFYRRRFPGIPTLTMTSNESELVKLGLNSAFAVKVAFFNELKSVADAHKLNWDRVLGGILSDGRIAHSHTNVPGPDGKYGFGGMCLPKDLANLINCAVLAGLIPEVMCAASHRNETDRERTV